MKLKVDFLNKMVRTAFTRYVAVFSAILSTILLFFEIPEGREWYSFAIFMVALGLMYLLTWWHANGLTEVTIKIEDTTVTVKAGDLFKEDGLKAIAFNEYFDTIVDDRLISARSLNGIYLNSKLTCSIEDLDAEIANYQFEIDEIIEDNGSRTTGKTVKFKLGTIFVKDDYLLTAMSKFDESNRAVLTMPEYLEFLINFWDRVNKVYAQRSVITPIFGSGITRIKGHKNITDEDLLKIMLWTFRISEMRFKHPAKLTIVIHESKIDQVNLLDLKALRNGV